MKLVSYQRGNSSPAAHWDAEGERKLMLAALEDGIRTLLGLRHGVAAAEWWREDYAWLMSPDRSEPFSFENICDVLNIDASYLRGRVLAALLPPPAVQRQPATRAAGAAFASLIPYSRAADPGPPGRAPRDVALGCECARGTRR